MNQFSSLNQGRFSFVSFIKRLLFVALFFFIVNVGFSQTVCTTGQFIKTTSAITIDGFASEGDWSTAPVNNITNSTANGTHPGASAVNNFSARWRGLWDNTGVYLFVEVNDPTMNFDPTVEQYYYDYDAVEVYISGTNDGLGSYQATDIQYGISDTSRISGTPYKGPNSGASTSVIGVKYIFTKIANQPFGIGGAGYDMEVFIPWTSVGIAAPSMDTKIGFDVAIDDNNSNPNAAIINAGDGNGLLGGLYRDEQFTWHNGGSDDYTNPHSFAGTPLTAPPSLPVAGSPQTICANDIATLAATSPAVGTGTWSVNVGSPSTSAAQFSNIHSATSNFTPAGGAGLYRLLWTVANDPCTTTNSPDTVNITVKGLPNPATINIGGGSGTSGTICSGGDTTIGFAGPSGAMVIYTVNSGGNQTIVLNSSGTASLPTGLLNSNTTYSLVSVTDGCTLNLSGSAVVAVQSSPDVKAGRDSLITSNTTYTFQGSVTPAGAYTYEWTDSIGNAVFVNQNSLNAQVTPTVTDDYILTARSNGLGCKGTGSVRISVVSTCFHPYNAFTPNGDGINDKWAVYDANGCFSSVDVSVYNRWGSLVYQAQNYQNTWDGTYKGELLPDGTYYYVIIVHYPDRTPTVTGNVTIIR